MKITGNIVVAWDLEPGNNPRRIGEFFATLDRHSGDLEVGSNAWVLHGATQYTSLTLTKYCGGERVVHHEVPGDHSADAPEGVPDLLWEYATDQAHVRECPGRTECISCC